MLCDFSIETASRPISKATLLEAMIAKDVNTCVEVLASDDSDWNRSQCEGQQDELTEPETAIGGGSGSRIEINVGRWLRVRGLTGSRCRGLHQRGLARGIGVVSAPAAVHLGPAKPVKPQRAWSPAGHLRDSPPSQRHASGRNAASYSSWQTPPLASARVRSSRPSSANPTSVTS